MAELFVQECVDLTPRYRAAPLHRWRYLRAQFYRLLARRGPKKAIVAVAASMLASAYVMLRDGVEYRDLGAEYFNTQQKEKVVAILLGCGVRPRTILDARSQRGGAVRAGAGAALPVAGALSWHRFFGSLLVLALTLGVLLNGVAVALPLVR